MSDNWIRVLPADPSFVPEPVIAEQFVGTVQTMLPASQGIEVKSLPEIHFVDAGGNWEGVRCPQCAADVEAYEDGQWWQRRMSESFETTNFADRRVEMPCCGTSSDLADLDYPWSVGFARWWIDCMNPGRGELAADEIGWLGEQLGHPVQIVYQHV